MMSDWVAVSVRGRGLRSRRLGRIGAQRLAAAGSLEAALTELASTPYGRDVRPGMTLATSQHAVFATLLWHLRILAGWARPGGAEIVRQLSAGFEIANIVAKLARLTQRAAEPEYLLGALGVSWTQIEPTRSGSELRDALAGSSWGDPGTDDLAATRIALEACWAHRVADSVPEARSWAVAYAALLVARTLVFHYALPAEGAAHRHLRAVLGSCYEGATTLAELAAQVPPAVGWLFDGIGGAEALWQAEVRWWKRIESDGFRLCANPQPTAGSVVGFVAILAADAWRVRGALELAARGGDTTEGWFDAVA